LTGQIDLDLINTGAGSATRRIRGDLKREVRIVFPVLIVIIRTTIAPVWLDLSSTMAFRICSSRRDLALTSR